MPDRPQVADGRDRAACGAIAGPPQSQRRCMRRRGGARAVFRRLDATGNKKVGLAEFIDGLQEMGIEVGAEDAEALLARFDDDGDGQISMSGFMRLLAAQPDARLQ